MKKIRFLFLLTAAALLTFTGCAQDTESGDDTASETAVETEATATATVETQRHNQSRRR